MKKINNIYLATEKDGSIEKNMAELPENDAVLHGVEALASDTAAGLFQFHIKEAGTGKIVAEIRQEVTEAKQNDTDKSLFFRLAAPVVLKAGIEYQATDNYTFFVIADGKSQGLRRECPNVPY